MRACAPVALILLLGGMTAAEEGEESLFRARHAELVQGDLLRAIDLYREALEEGKGSEAEQALLHLRIALCHERLGQDLQALDHLAPSIFTRRGVSSEAGRRADDLRQRLKARQPRPAERAVPPSEDTAAQRARRLAEHLAQARRHLEERNDVHAFRHIQAALELDPDHPEARALEAQWETLLSGMTQLLLDPLRFVRSWSEAQVRAVSREAQSLLKEALGHAKTGTINLAESRFRAAVEAIDACEFAGESDELLTLRQTILGHRTEAYARLLGDARTPPPLPEQRRRTTAAGDFLNHLQRMLDVLSEPGREYRIIPVRTRRGGAATRAVFAKPRGFLLLRDEAPSRFTAALFARAWLPLRVQPPSWKAKGNYVESAGEMLIARNSPEVLDALQAEVRRLDAGEAERRPMRARFLFVSAPRVALSRLEERYGAFQRSDRGGSPALFLAVPKARSLEEICGTLRDGGADVKFPSDLFEIELENGAPQTLFAAMPLGRALAYADLPIAAAGVFDAHYGLLLDAFPLRDATGRTAMMLHLSARLPAPPTRTEDGSILPRFLTQDAEIFSDIEAGATLVVAGLADPFAAGAGTSDPDRTLLLLWNTESPGETATTPPAEEEIPTAEIPLRDLLLGVRDNPGPRVDPRQGFVRRDPVEVLEARARFLREVLSDHLHSPEVEVDVDEAVARVPRALRERAVRAVEELGRQAKSGFVVRIQALALPTPVFERIMAREELPLASFGDASLAMLGGSGGEFLLRDLRQREPGDVFAPGTEFTAMTVLGLQAQHSLSARTHTSPAYASEEELTQGTMRTVTEGLRVSVRPWVRGPSLLGWVEVETCALESEVEELALMQAVPSYRTEVSGTRAAGLVDFGDAVEPRIALVCRIPHPTASSPEKLMEIIVAVSIRRMP